jgi:hypothetical protein
MRRLACHLFAFCSAASLLLCVAVCVLWVRSYRSADQFWVNRATWGLAFRSNAGDSIIRVARLPNARPHSGKSTRFGYGLGPQVGPHAPPGMYPIQWRRGPISYAAVPPTPPITADQVRAYEQTLATWDRVKGIPVPPGLNAQTIRVTLEMEASVAASVLAQGGEAYWWHIVFPAGIVLVMTLILPAAFAARFLPFFRARRRRRAGLCGYCEYDLRASPERCPECGTVPSTNR